MPPLYNPKLVDEIVGIRSEDAAKSSARLQKTHGLPFSTAAGAVYLAAEQVANRRENAGKVTVALLGG
jgi:cysteine synthase A